MAHGKHLPWRIYTSLVRKGLMQKAMSFKDVTILFIKGNDHRIHFWYKGKDEAINITKNSDLSKKVDHYKNIKNLISLSIYKTWVITILFI